jgi:acyl carrier protein
MPDSIEELIVRVANELVAQDELVVEGEIGPETALFGQDGVLDSMALVSLVVAVEQAIEESHGVTVSLADEKALSQRQSPYRTVSTLAAYAQSLIDS